MATNVLQHMIHDTLSAQVQNAVAQGDAHGCFHSFLFLSFLSTLVFHLTSKQFAQTRLFLLFTNASQRASPV